MVTNNENLHRSKANKQDEFYTQYSDIEKEMENYSEIFSGKIVYCNCDNSSSNFYKYFKNNFKKLSLKKLIATCYNPNGKGKLYTYEGNGYPYVCDLDGDGDFASEECIDILKSCDIVCTNPPFSLLRKYLRLILESGKSFIVLGNQNAITHKEIFPYLKENKIWFGQSISGGDRKFNVPDDYPLYAAVSGYDASRPYVKVTGVRWLTNVPNKKRRTPLDLTRNFNGIDYPKYENYDAINVDRTCDIPKDYCGLMGVPITFLDKYDPTQFEIVSSSDFASTDINGWKSATKEFVDLYYEQGNKGMIREGWTLPHYIKNGEAVIPYKRLLIRRCDI